jgi:polysaccharide export outer membrane protein
MNRILLFLTLGLMSLSCVPTSKEILLQGKTKRENAPVDKTVSKFNTREYEYRLRPEDVISIQINSLTDSEFDFFNTQNQRDVRGTLPRDPLLSGFQVEKDGTIPLPVVGKIEVEGLTLEEARAKIEKVVAQYLDSPTVDLKLLNFQYTILGEVKNVGRFTTYNPRLNILEALGEAGGFLDFADRSRIQIVRKNKEEVEIAYVNILDENVIESPYYYLQPNDIITIAPLEAKNWRMNNIANIGIIFSGISAITLLLLRWN